MTTHTATQLYTHELNVKFADEPQFENFGIMEGKRYDRIVRLRNGASQSVFAFVERETGLLVKAAGWAAPAKRVDGSLQSKYDLSDPEQFAAAVAEADRFGGYLYVR